MISIPKFLFLSTVIVIWVLFGAGSMFFMHTKKPPEGGFRLSGNQAVNCAPYDKKLIFRA
ncbi:MAG TPA: hypothetical protein DIW64_09810 [Cellvibrio sp.]|nr:hypothetical protein [Cellvibrio sp.]